MKKSPKSTEIIKIPISRLEENPRNPNVLPPEMFERLKLAIKRFGFTQPILVKKNKSNGKYTIVDGNHRYRVALELGYKELPATITTDDERVQSISMNKLRGHLDGNITAELLNEVVSDGWKVEELTLTGFSEEELLEMLNPSVDTLPEPDVKITTPESEKEEWTLEVKFESKDDLNYVKKVLRKFSKGKGYAVGLLNVCRMVME